METKELVERLRDSIRELPCPEYIHAHELIDEIATIIEDAERHIGHKDEKAIKAHLVASMVLIDAASVCLRYVQQGKR